MKNFNLSFLTFAFCILHFAFCKAQSPQSFNYQLIARDTNGLVLNNQAIGVQLSILKDAFNGTVVYCERHTATTNNYGLVTLNIGSGIFISGNFSSIDWGNYLHFLKLEIDPAGGTTYFNMGATQLVSVPYSLYAEKAGTVTDTSNASKWTQAGNNIYNKNSGNVGIGTDTPTGKLIVKGDSLALATEPLFEVKNKDGDPVFVVYPDSVRITFTQSAASKANAQGGFAVSGRSSSKGATSDYLVITPDSSRIYLEEASDKATALGGFAVSGRSSSKGGKNDYLNVSVNTNETINPSKPRILWFPTKEAFLTGRVLIESPDSVGTNSFASGFESKAKGGWSQALGYKAIARGNYSTAIGDSAIAKGHNSYAFGNNAYSEDSASYAIGSGAKATGLRSFAVGSSGVDSAGIATNPTVATGDYSYAFGMGSQAIGPGAFAFGTQDTATGYYSLSMGYQTKASGYQSMSMGKYSIASGQYSTAMGYQTIASEYSSMSMGLKTKASGQYSTAIGWFTTASGDIATSMGAQTKASGYISTAMGYLTTASGWRTTAMGYQTTAKPMASLVIGQYNDTTCSATGMSNWIATDPLFIIGNGSDDSNRSNALTVLKNGETYLPAVYDATVGTTNRDLYIDDSGKLGYISSSIRYKKNISDMENVDWLYKLHPVNYAYKKDNLNKKQYGLIAEEVEKINPLFVSYNPDGTVETVNYSSFVSPMLKALQDQQKEIEALKKQNAELKIKNQEIDKIKAENQSMKSEIENIKSFVGMVKNKPYTSLAEH